MAPADCSGHLRRQAYSLLCCQLLQLLHHYCLNQRHPCTERAALARSFGPVVLRPAGQSVLASADVCSLLRCIAHCPYPVFLYTQPISVSLSISANMCTTSLFSCNPEALHALDLSASNDPARMVQQRCSVDAVTARPLPTSFQTQGSNAQTHMLSDSKFALGICRKAGSERNVWST